MPRKPSPMSRRSPRPSGCTSGAATLAPARHSSVWGPSNRWQRPCPTPALGPLLVSCGSCALAPLSTWAAS
eukprot:15176400-Alexandrium_andersonii.AAC.1